MFTWFRTHADCTELLFFFYTFFAFPKGSTYKFMFNYARICNAWSEKENCGESKKNKKKNHVALFVLHARLTVCSFSNHPKLFTFICKEIFVLCSRIITSLKLFIICELIQLNKEKVTVFRCWSVIQGLNLIK